MHSTEKVLGEVRDERVRQHEKHGDRTAAQPATPHGMTHENLDLFCLSVTTLVAEQDAGPKVIEENAKVQCELAFKRGWGTFAHILWEEIVEAFCATDEDELRKELVQVAACAVAGVEAIDARRGPKWRIVKWGDKHLKEGAHIRRTVKWHRENCVKIGDNKPFVVRYVSEFTVGTECAGILHKASFDDDTIEICEKP